MDDYQDWEIEGRLTPYHVAPVPIIDRWNGKDIVVHQTSWDYYTFDINVNAVQMQMLGIILLCEDVIIDDTENDLKIILDTTLPDYNTFEIGDFIGQTSNYQVIVKCRANIMYVNRQTVTLNTFNITINTVPYYTDNSLITIVLESKFDNDKDNDGLDPASSSDYKKALKYVFYMTESERNTFKTAFEGTKTSLITCFDGTINNPLLENSTIKEDEEPLTNDFYKLVVTCVIDADRKYFN